MIIGILGGITLGIIGVPIYNGYALPAMMHKEIMDKLEAIDKKLQQKLEN